MPKLSYADVLRSRTQALSSPPTPEEPSMLPDDSVRDRSGFYAPPRWLAAWIRRLAAKPVYPLGHICLRETSGLANFSHNED